MRIKRQIMFCLLGCLYMLPLRADTGELQQLVDELQRLSEKSRQSNAADRWLQNDIEALIEKYSNPWRKRLLKDTFEHEKLTKSVPWQVGSGEFWIDRRLGLRSRVEEKQLTSEPPAEQRNSEKDLAKALVGALLKETLGGGTHSDSQPRQETRTEIIPASIRAAVNVPTTFAVETAFSINNRPGEHAQYEWVVMQDDEGRNGYMLVIALAPQGQVEVVRIRGGKAAYIGSAELPALNKGGEQVLAWRQKSNGAIDVVINGENVMSVSHRPFRYGFKYFGMVNRAGDISVSSIEVLGNE